EGLGHAAMKPTALWGARLAVRHVAQPVVAEVVCVQPLLADDALAPELVESVRDDVLVADQAHQDLQVESASDDRSRCRDLPRAFRELGQAAGYHRMGSGRKAG